MHAYFFCKQLVLFPFQPILLLIDPCVIMQAVSVPSNFETSFTTEDIKAKLIEKYRSSEYSINTRKKIRQIALINVSSLHSRYLTSCLIILSYNLCLQLTSSARAVTSLATRR